jgi:hypothetical protein
VLPRAKTMRNDITYEEFLERVKNPVTKCVMHDDAVNAASLIEMWKGIAEHLQKTLQEENVFDGTSAYKSAIENELKIINSYSWQGNNK